MDESSKQLIKETGKSIAMKPGQEARADFEYERCGVVNIFLASELLLKGKRYVKGTERKTKNDRVELTKVLLMNAYSDAEKIILVMDNLATHRAAA